MEKSIVGKVVRVLDEYTIVINRGAKDGVTNSDRYIIYNLGDEIIEPDTNESLGRLELVCGEGKPTHIQENLTTLETAKFEVSKSKVIRKNGGWASFVGGTEEEIIDPHEIKIAFKDVNIGSLVKQIR